MCSSYLSEARLVGVHSPQPSCVVHHPPQSQPWSGPAPLLVDQLVLDKKNHGGETPLQEVPPFLQIPECGIDGDVVIRAVSA